MKKAITLALFLLTANSLFAHYLWIETNPKGELNKEQEIRVYYGEYTYGVVEKVNGEAFPKVKDFTIWVIDPSGHKIELQTEASESFYTAKFTPSVNGTYTVLLNNDKIDVIDYTKYDFGIFKTHYHSVAKIQVGDPVKETIASNENGITLKDISESTEEIKLHVFFKGKPLPNNELKVFVADQWSKTLETDENGMVSFKLPWKTKYIVETTIKEEVPGKYNGKDYEFTWHCVTYCIL